MSVKTGDKANAGGMLAVAGVAGMIAALAQKIKRRGCREIDSSKKGQI